ncbi:DUF7532 family protein [Natronorubrum thiooxidans]|uniref:Uncharacterized protein n=1 Tax=Natronorubrum thiooxidans TaxID=308853 RepID=A0A1N7CU55_9EURY|nr:hypothetical protein [Natronorubrum thiooxidans]SIR67178.1 hypothetical protein SAMN05421752_101583 [Natronorubrum thiooxidans]
MHFDQRTQQALRGVGLETDDVQATSDAVTEAVDAGASTLEAFFERHDTVELTLGPTINDRVRFASDCEHPR